MKYSKYINSLMAVALAGVATSCSDFLEKTPQSLIVPENYYSSESQIDAIIMDEYPNTFGSGYGYGYFHGSWSYGTFNLDEGTDNQIYKTAHSRFTTDRWTVGSSNSYWTFYRMYYLNYDLEMILPRFGDDINGSQNTISGDLATIKHYIGEIYFMRALDYFRCLQYFGDYPIVKETLPDDLATLTEASKRQPRNEVARFILDDLDKAIEYMSDVDLIKTRVNKDAALLFKSRVALFEASWLKYFKGSAFVPGGEGWPGASYWDGTYSYPSGSIDNEINYFLDQAMDASKQVAEKYYSKLTNNTGHYQGDVIDSDLDAVANSEKDIKATNLTLTDLSGTSNPYYDMFCDEDLSGYNEVLFWKQFAFGLSTHNVNAAASRGNYVLGATRQYVQNFLMLDGSPVYTHGTYADGDGYYMGDKTVANVRRNRDTRLSIFLKVPGQYNAVYELDNTYGTDLTTPEPYPLITSADSERGYSTGYAFHKGGNMNRKYYANGGGYTGSPIFRTAEALLNYMEASYMRNGTIDSYADKYWRAIRKRAGINEDYNYTISLTDMSKEAENDWGAYSAGQLLSDKTLYNIRRERRCEFLSEGFRRWDLYRWRSMDQLIDNPSHLEGIHLWNTPQEKYFVNALGKSTLTYDKGTSSSVSSPSVSEYLRPFERDSSIAGYEGCTWRMAHYLQPLPISEMLLTSPDGDSAENSVMYQNPYWPLTPGSVATK